MNHLQDQSEIAYDNLLKTDKQILNSKILKKVNIFNDNLDLDFKSDYSDLLDTFGL